MLVLVVKIRRVHEDAGASDVNLIAKEVQDVHEDFAIVLLWIHSSRLDLRHGLQNVRDQADGSEATNATTEDFVDSTHNQQLFDQSNKNWHGGVLLLPRLKCLECWEARVVLKRDINFDTCALVGELHNRHFGPSNKSGRLWLCDTESLDVCGETAKLILRLADLTRTAALERLGQHHQVHIRSG